MPSRMPPRPGATDPDQRLGRRRRHRLVREPDGQGEADGGSGSVLISVTLVQATATVSGSVLAYVGDLGSPTGMTPATFKAGSLDVEARHHRPEATTRLNPVSIGLVGGGVGPNGQTAASTRSPARSRPTSSRPAPARPRDRASRST